MAATQGIEAGTIPGAEGIYLQEENSHGILLLHGFGDTPQTLALLATDLHTAGYDVVAPLLPGHGRSVDAFLRSRRADWIACAREELAALQKTHAAVAIAGLSMGGALAAILAAESPGLKALVLLAPYLDMPRKVRLASASGWIWGSAAGARKSGVTGSILDPAERAKNLGYGVYSGRLLYELWRLAQSARRGLSLITAPTLLIQSRSDPRIASSVAEEAFAAIGATEKQLVWVEGAGHIITVDYGHAKVLADVKNWMSKYSPTKR